MTFTCWCRVFRMQSCAVREYCITRAHNPRANRPYTNANIPDKYVVTWTVLNFYRALTTVTRTRELCCPATRIHTHTLWLGTCISGGAAVAVGTSPEHSLTREVKRARANRRHMAIPRVVHTISVPRLWHAVVITRWFHSLGVFLFSIFSPPRPRGSTSAHDGLLSDIIPPRTREQ